MTDRTSTKPSRLKLPKGVKWRHTAYSSNLCWYLSPKLAAEGATTVKYARLWTGPAGSEPTADQFANIVARADRMNEQVIRHRSEAAEEHSVVSDQATRQAMKGSVYFVYGGGRIKIGFATSPNVRLGHLQAASPDELEPLALIPGSSDVEHFIQFMFRKHHIRDEWFEDVPELRSFIRDHATPWTGDRVRSKRRPGWSRHLAHHSNEVMA